MKNRLKLFIKYAILLGIISFCFYIFYPRKYDVLPYEKNQNTKQWKLSTGSNIGYVFIGAVEPKKDYPIIYLHGGPAGVITKNILKMLVPFSEEGYDIYAYDQVGSGSSERLENIEDYTVARHKADLKEIINNIEAQKVILIGQSWGSVLASFYAIDNPSKVEKIIMTGPGPVFPINPSVAGLKAPDSLDLRAPKHSNQEANDEVYTFRDKCIRWCAKAFGYKLAPDEEVDDFFTKLNSALKRSTVRDASLVEESSGGGGYYAHIMTMKSLGDVADPRTKMKKLMVPTLIMKGQYDNQKWGFTNEYLTLLPNATLRIIPDAGHVIQAEQPGLYNNEIKRFLLETTNNR